MSQPSSYLPSIVVLAPLLIAAVVLTAIRPRLRPEVRVSSRFLVVVGLTIGAQSLHFLEELRFDLFSRFPQVFGLEPVSESSFVSINVTALATWVLSLFAVRAGLVIAVFPLWFLGLAMVLNVLLHPILALRAGGYFPGLLTAPLVGVLGVLSLRQLARVTAPETAASHS